MTYQPKCELSWASACMATDEMAKSRTVEQVMAELNQSIATLAEIEQLPQPHCEMTQYRRLCAEWLAHRAIVEAQSVTDARQIIKKAAEVKAC